MMVGLAIGILQPFLYLLISDTITACIVLAITGLAGTFLSGADTALLYETAEEAGGSELARKAMARASGLQLGALAIAPVLAGYMYEWRDWAPAGARALICVISLWVVWGMSERRQAPSSERRVSLWTQTKSAVSVVRHNQTAMRLMVFGWVYNTALAMTGQFGQAYFPYIGLSMGVAGTVFAIARIVSSGTSTFSEHLSTNTAARFLRFAPLAVALAVAGMGWGMPWLGILSFVMIEALDGAFWPIHQHQFNESIPSAQRATILSLQSSGFSMMMTVSFPAASYLPSVPRIYTVTGIVFLAAAIVWAATLGSRKGTSLSTGS